MSEDPLHLGALDPDAIAEAVESKKMTKKAKDPIAKMNAETAAKREERLQGPEKGRMPATPRTDAPPPEPVVDKSLLLDKISLFRERFPHVKSRNKVTAKSAVEEIEDELHYIEQQLGQRDGHMGEHLLVLAMSALEESTKHYNPLHLNLSGLAQVTKDNQDQFKPILDELFIKYGAQMYVGPEMRLAMALGTMVYTVHSANSGNVAVAAAMEKMGQRVVMPKSDL